MERISISSKINEIKANGENFDIRLMSETLTDGIIDHYEINEEYTLVPVELSKIIFDENDLIEDESGYKVILPADKATVVAITDADIEADVKADMTTYLDTDETVLKVLAVSLGYGWASLIDDEDRAVQINIIRKGYKPEVFVKKDSYCRAEVAKLGLYHEELYKDENVHVRAAVASKTDDEKIINELSSFEEDGRVKIELAKRDKKSEKLSNDLAKAVRIAVAENTKSETALKILLKDDSDRVKSAAVKNENLTQEAAKELLAVDEEGKYLSTRYARIELAEQAVKHNWTEIQEKLAEDGAVEVRLTLANAGVLADKFLADTNVNVRQAAYKAKYEPESETK